jgi:hypothetical protein
MKLLEHHIPASKRRARPRLCSPRAILNASPLHSAKEVLIKKRYWVPSDRSGSRLRFPRLSYLWLYAGYQGKGKERAEQELGAKAEAVKRSPKTP